MCEQHNLLEKHFHNQKLILPGLFSSAPDHWVSLEADAALCQRCRRVFTSWQMMMGWSLQESASSTWWQRASHRATTFYYISWRILHSSLKCSPKAVLDNIFLVLFLSEARIVGKNRQIGDRLYAQCWEAFVLIVCVFVSLSRLSCIRCCSSFLNCMREEWRDSNWT